MPCLWMDQSGAAHWYCWMRQPKKSQGCCNSDCKLLSHPLCFCLIGGSCLSNFFLCIGAAGAYTAGDLSLAYIAVEMLSSLSIFPRNGLTA